VGDVHLIDARARQAERGNRLLKPRSDLVVKQVAEVASREPKPQRQIRPVGGAQQRTVDQPRVGDRSGKGPDVVE